MSKLEGAEQRAITEKDLGEAIHDVALVAGEISAVADAHPAVYRRPNGVLTIKTTNHWIDVISGKTDHPQS